MATRYGKFVDFNDPLRFEDVPARNAFEYLEIIYIARNDLHFSADSMGICSLIFTQLRLKVEPSESKTASAKTEFYMI